MAGNFKWVHNMAIDSKGTIYTAEVGDGRRVQKFKRGKLIATFGELRQSVKDHDWLPFGRVDASPLRESVDHRALVR
jgi:hypothetical protein